MRSVVLFLPGANEALIFPDAAGVIFRTCNDRVTLIVERTRENFILVPLVWVCSQALNLVSGLRGPKSARLVAARRNDLVTLRVE